jgi:4-hydroxy-tetrahydrodipicolinate reductase
MAARGRGVDLKKVSDHARHGETGARGAGKIGFSVARGGDVVGDHTVYFYGEGERIELSHRATNRALFAKGAIRAAIWAEKQPNGLYSIRDMLGL